MEADHSSSRCLEAFIVALNQSWDQEQWYTSTKELQLASLRFCGACRSVTTLWLGVTDDTPPRLLAPADAPGSSPDEGGSTRVPHLRARTVTWNRSTTSELSRPLYALTDVERLLFSGTISTERVVWPRRLRVLYLGAGIWRQTSVNWPPSLQQLEFGDDFNWPINSVSWPPSLQQLIFGETFNQSVVSVVWPPSLQQLEFGYEFNQPVDSASWPPSLQQLSFGRQFNQPIGSVSWPSSLQQLSFGVKFNQPVDSVSWPPSLQQLSFGRKFNQPVDSASWPPSLQQLSLGYCFDQPVSGVSWPPSLQQLKFGYHFNQAVEGVTWPRSLQQISFGGGLFNRPIEGVAWPESLRKLEFGPFFNQPIARVTWPASLQDLSFGILHRDGEFERFNSNFDQAINQAVWPASLRRLTLGGSFRQSLRGLGVVMRGLEDFTLLVEDYSCAVGIEWPKTLKRVKIFQYGVEKGVVVPPTVGVVVALDMRNID